MQAQVDPILISYVKTLESERTFKAKIVYTLSCILNFLTAVPQSLYSNNLHYLADNKTSLASLATLHPDCGVLQQLMMIFHRFESAGFYAISEQLLNRIIDLEIQSQLTNTMLDHLGYILSRIKHTYANTKKLCIKLLQAKAIKSENVRVLMGILGKECRLSFKECCLIAQHVPQGSAKQVCALLDIMTRACTFLVWSSKNVQQVKKEVCQIIINYLDQYWHDQLVKYMCIQVAIASCVGETNLQLSPAFLNAFLHNNPKPFYLSYTPELSNKGINKNLIYFLTHFSRQKFSSDSPNFQTLIKSLSIVFPELQPNSDGYQLLQGVLDDNLSIPQILLNRYQSILPIQMLSQNEKLSKQTFARLNFEMTLGNAYFTAQGLLHRITTGRMSGKLSSPQIQICLQLMMVYLCNKQHTYLLTAVKSYLSSCSDINFKNFHSQLSNNNNALLFLPLLFEDLISIEQYPQVNRAYLIKSIEKFMASEEVKMQSKFYVAQKLIKMRYQPGVSKFVYFLLRSLNKTKLQYEQIAYYLRKQNNWTQQDIKWVQYNFQEEIQRIQEKLFSRLVDCQFKAPKQIIYALQKYGAFQQWAPVYRWTLNPLDEPQFANPQSLIDSLEVLQTVIQNCKQVPVELIKRFFAIVAKHWKSYSHHHLFTIERISNVLFAEQELNPQHLEELSSYLKKLPQREWHSSNSKLYSHSLSLLIKNTLLEQTQDLDQGLIKAISSILIQLMSNTEKLSSYENLQILLYSQEVLMWRFQYQDQVIKDQIAQLIIKVIANFDSIPIVNEQDRHRLVCNCLQIMASVGHNSNLLDLDLAKVLTYFVEDVQILDFGREIVANIKDVNMKAIGKFKLDKLIPQILCSLITCQNTNLAQAQIDLLNQLSWPQQSPYLTCMIKYSELFVEMLRSQALFLTNKYRPDVALFALEWTGRAGAHNYLSPKWLKMIWLKYYDHKPSMKTNDEKQLQTIAILCQQICKQLQNYKICINDKYKIKSSKIQQEKPKQDFQITPNKKQQNRQFTESKKENQVNKNEQTATTTASTKLNQQNQTQTQRQDQKIGTPKAISTPVKPSISLQQIPIEDSETKRQISAQSPLKQVKQSSNSSIQLFKSAKAIKNVNPNPLTHSKKKRTVQMQEQAMNIKNIKGHINFIGSIGGIKTTQAQFVQLKQALAYLSEVVAIQYYCKKIVNLGIVSKCLALHESTLSSVLTEVLELFFLISESKQKNLIIFSDSSSITLFKTQLKQSIQSHKERPQTLKIMSIINNCWSTSCADFFSSGLLSMLFEMAKQSLNRVQILQLLASTSNDLSFQIVNEIYQRGMFNIMETSIRAQTTQLSEIAKKEIVLWCRIMGKVAVNLSIRDKFWSIQLHQKIWSHHHVFEELTCTENLAFLFASYCYEYEKVALWCMENKIVQYFLGMCSTYEQAIPSQYFKFFRYIAQNGSQQVQHLFRIQLHTFLLSILPTISHKVKHEGYKHFFKCLSHLFVPEHYEYFLKVELCKILVQRFREQHSYFLLECLEKLVRQLKDKKEIQLLDKQGLFSLNNVFNSKVKDDLSYPYLLQIYITLLQKFKKFDTKYLNADLANKVIRKSIFSINMEGKKKTLQFLIQFSEIDKISYGNANCSRLFQSLLNYHIGEEELRLLYDYLKVEEKYSKPPRPHENLQEQQEKYPLRFKSIVDIPCESLLEILLTKLLELQKQSTTGEVIAKNNLKPIKQITDILKFFNNNEQNSSIVFQKIGTLLIRSADTICQFKDSLKIINLLLMWKPVQTRYKQMQTSVLNYIKAVFEHFNKSDVDDETIDTYCQVLEKCLKSNVIEQEQLISFCMSSLQSSKYSKHAAVAKFIKLCSEFKNPGADQLSSTVKSIMKSGVRVKMYKTDGSNSSLLLYFTDDLLELHCVTSLGEEVKNKWKLSMIEIIKIEEYKDETAYKNSVFYLSEGIFTKAPPFENCLTLVGKSKNFHINFETISSMQEWKKFIEIAKTRAMQIILKIS